MVSIHPARSSALTFGMMAGDSTWQEGAGWDGIVRSGATTFRMQVSRENYGTYGWEQIDRAFRFAAVRSITILPYFYDQAKRYSVDYMATTANFGKRTQTFPASQ